MFKFCLAGFGALWLGMTAPLHAGTTATDFQASKRFTKSLSMQSLNAMQQFKPEAYFKGYTETPAEQGHYQGVETDKVDLTPAALEALKQDAGGKTVYDNASSRPVFKINANNAAIQQAKLIQDESYAITHGISNDKVHCEEKEAACETTYVEETCHAARQLPVTSCVKTRQVSVGVDEINQATHIDVSIAKNFTGFVSINLITGSVGGAGGAVLPQLHLPHGCEAMGATIHSVLNNKQKADWVDVVTMPSCQNNGSMTLHITHSFKRNYPIQIALTLHTRSKAYVSDDRWDNACLAHENKKNDALCHVTDEMCTDSTPTRMINGLSVTRDCWKTRATYACITEKTDECVAQKEKGCLQSRSQCVRMQEGGCALYEQIYRCPEKICTPKVVCLHDVFCADGSCTDTDATQNTNFGQDVAALATAGEAGREVATQQVSLFAGHATSCNIHDFGFLDCCSDKGWGEKIKLAHCSEEDKALGKAKLDYLAHYIGKYCAKYFPWPADNECEKWKHTYCVFDSKMARIVQEEGRLKQLNKDALGTPEHPHCEGLSLDEFQQLKMNLIDFVSPVYPFKDGQASTAAGIAGDIHPNTPNAGTTADYIQQHMQPKVGVQ